MNATVSSPDDSQRRSSYRKTKKFACRYYHAGSWWSVHIDAFDAIDADARVKKLGNLLLDGELLYSGPARFAFAGRALCWVRNLFH